MIRPAVTASTPTRIDLAGGTIDIWPLSVVVPEAVTVNLAIELRAWASVAPRSDGKLVVVSKDRRRRVSRSLPLQEPNDRNPLGLLIRLVRAFSPEIGLTLTTRAEAPAGAGLGGSSALGIAVTAALDRLLRARLGRDGILRRTFNVEARQLGVPTGNQDYLAALDGGLCAWRHTVDGTVRERIPVPRGFERRLVLAYTGQPRQSGFSNWDMFRRFLEKDRTTVRRMEAIARIARDLREALLAGDLREAGVLLGEEGRLRFGLAPSVATPSLLRTARAAREAGALGVKVCGAGGGGCLVALSEEGRSSTVATAMRRAGARILPCRIARKGLTLSGR